MVEELVGMELDPVVDYMNPLMIVQRRMVVVLVAVAVGALVLVVAGLVRFVRAFLPRKKPPGLP
jgi:hypothetical protein